MSHLIAGRRWKTAEILKVAVVGAPFMYSTLFGSHSRFYELPPEELCVRSGSTRTVGRVFLVLVRTAAF